MNLKNIFAFNALLLFLVGCLICLACFDIIQNAGSQRKLNLRSAADNVLNHTILEVSQKISEEKSIERTSAKPRPIFSATIDTQKSVIGEDFTLPGSISQEENLKELIDLRLVRMKDGVPVRCLMARVFRYASIYFPRSFKDFSNQLCGFSS